jgi:hypothetical protein
MFVHIAPVCPPVYISIKPNSIDSLTWRSQSKGYSRRTHWRHSPNPTPYNISASFPRRRAVTSQLQRGFKGFCRWHNMILRELLSEMLVSVGRAVCLSAEAQYCERKFVRGILSVMDSRHAAGFCLILNSLSKTTKNAVWDDIRCHVQHLSPETIHF